MARIGAAEVKLDPRALGVEGYRTRRRMPNRKITRTYLIDAEVLETSEAIMSALDVKKSDYITNALSHYNEFLLGQQGATNGGSKCRI